MSNTHPLYWDRGIAFTLLRLLGRFQTWLVYDQIKVLGPSIPDHGPCIIVATHTGRFTDIMLGLTTTLNPNRGNRYMTVAWAGFISWEWALHQFHMIPLENQFKGEARSDNRQIALSQLENIVTYLSGVDANDSKSTRESKAVLIFPSGKCGIGRFEEPWKLGLSRITAELLKLTNEDVIIQIVPIVYSCYGNHLHSEVEVYSVALRFGSHWRSLLATNERLARKWLLESMESVLKNQTTWHDLDAPKLAKVIAELQGATPELEDSQVKRLQRLAGPTAWQNFCDALQHTSAKQHTSAYELLLRSIKAQITLNEDVLIAVCREIEPALLKRVEAVSTILRKYDWQLPDKLQAQLTEYTQLLNQLDLPYGREVDQLTAATLLGAPMVLLALPMYSLMWLLQRSVAAPFRKWFNRPDHLLQFRGENAIWQMLIGWGLAYSTLFVVATASGLLLLPSWLCLWQEQCFWQEQWYWRAALILTVAGASVFGTLLVAVTAFKLGWRYRLALLRAIGYRQLVRIDQLRHSIQQFVLSESELASETKSPHG